MKNIDNHPVDSIKLPGHRLPICSKAIIRLEGYGNYSWVHLSTQSRPLLIALTLKWFEDQLPAFIRVHKSEMINPNFVQKIELDGPQPVEICLFNEHKAKVSRRRFEQVLHKIIQYQKANLLSSTCVTHSY